MFVSCALLVVLGLAVPAATPASTNATVSRAPSASAGASQSRAAHPSLKVRLNGDFDTLDPTTSINTSTLAVGYFLYDTLLAVSAKGKLMPYVASSWTQTPDSATFKIRKGVVCADGEKMNALAVARAMIFFLGRSPAAKRLFGPPPYRVTSNPRKGTVTLKLSQPNSDFLYGTPQMFLVCPKGLANPDSLATTPYGSGPFTLVAASHNRGVTLKARSNWRWGPGGTTTKTPGFPARVEYVEVTNDTTAANLLTTGGLDYAQINGPDVTRLLRDDSLTSQYATSYFGYPLIMNETKEHPTADPAVRKAILTAVDPKKWNATAYGGYGVVSPSFLMPNADCYNPKVAKYLPKPSAQAARAVLQKAGWKIGSDGYFQKNGATLKIVINGSNTQGSGPAYLSAALNAAGIATDLRVVPYQNYALANQAGNFDIDVEAIPSNTPAPSANVPFIAGPEPPNGLNFARNQDPVVDRYVNLGKTSVGKARCAAWGKVQEFLVRHYHIVPLSAPKVYWFGRKGVKSLAPGTIFPPSWSLRG